MDKNIEEIVKQACNREGIAKRCPERVAEALKNAGYGNIKQAVTKFAEKLKEKSNDIVVIKGHERIFTEGVSNRYIDELIKKLYGE